MSLTQTQTSQLYVSIFGRASEGDGNQFWMNAADMSGAAVSMLESAAAKNYFGTSLNTNQAFIEHIYTNTLGKTYADDKTGIDFWVSKLDSGISRGKIIVSIVDAAQKPETAGAAQDQFNNKVLISNYTAVKIDTCTDLSIFTGFISGVDESAVSVELAKARVDAFADPILPYANVSIPSGLDLDWVNNNEVDDYPYRAIGRISVENSSGIIDDYLFNGGALDLSGSMLSAGGASGSPVFYEENDNYYCVRVYAGTYGDDPVAVTIDSDSYNWLLEILG